MENQPRKKLLIVGPAQSGKDTACNYLAEITQLRFAGSTSVYLAPFVADQLGVSPEKAYQTRHLNRNLWNRVGNAIRRQDTGYFVRKSLENADIIAGIRDIEELLLCRRENLVDLIIWIANTRIRKDSTLKFSEQDCDITIPNHWDLDAFTHRLHRLADFADLPMRSA